MVNLRYFHKPTHCSLRKALLALRDHSNLYRIDNRGIPQRPYDLDRRDWTEEQKIINETFGVLTFNLPFWPENSAQAHQTWSQTSNGFTEKTNHWYWSQSITDLGPQAFSSSQFTPKGSSSQCMDALEWIDEPTFQNCILCQTNETLKTYQTVFQQVFPPALAQDIQHFSILTTRVPI